MYYFKCSERHRSFFFYFITSEKIKEWMSKDIPYCAQHKALISVQKKKSSTNGHPHSW